MLARAHAGALALAAALAALAALVALPGGAHAQSPQQHPGADSAHAASHRHPAATPGSQARPDSAFAALQARGKVAMGVDQYTSVHRFDALPDGGRIELQRPGADTAAVRVIREHMQDIARKFGSGDFSTPSFVHMQDVPGTAVMAARRDVIRYVYRPLPEGAEVRLYTTDPEAVRAVHAFMAFQRTDHRAGGRH